MTLTINPDRLRELRKAQGLTLDDLKARSRVSRETIHRIENGYPQRTRASTLRKLSGALTVPEEVLTGQMPLPTVSRSDRDLARENKSHLNVEIGDAAHNAYVLVAQRYGIPKTRVAELAPFLFALAAEQSLRWRKGLLDQFDALLDQQQAMLSDFPHLPTSISTRDDAADAINAERRSIDSKDILAAKLPDEIYENFGLLKYRYDETAHNPFVRYLSQLASEYSGVLDLTYFSADDMTLFTVCKDDVKRLTADDEALTNAVRFGMIQLSKMPRHFFDDAQSQDRIAWMRSEFEKTEQSMLESIAKL